MSARLIGQLALSACVPLVHGAVVGILASLNAQLAGALAASARLSVTPPTLVAQLSAAQQIVIALQAQIALGLPTVDIQLSALAALIASIQAQIAILAAFPLTTEVFMYVASGKANRFAGDLASVIGAGPPGTQPNDDTAAILIGGSVPAAVGAIATFFGVTFP